MKIDERYVQKFTDIKIRVNPWLIQSINRRRLFFALRIRTTCTQKHTADAQVVVAFLIKHFKFVFISRSIGFIFFLLLLYCYSGHWFLAYAQIFASDCSHREHSEHKQFCVERLKKDKKKLKNCSTQFCATLALCRIKWVCRRINIYNISHNLDQPHECLFFFLFDYSQTNNFVVKW